jgi:tungstate transport system ATP-binding protein
MSNGAILPLRLAEVSFAAGGRTIIDRVSLEIETGPSTIILGANGAGKSVLMRLMHGLLEPSSGRIDWNAPERPGAPRKQAMVFQRPVMLRRSAYANIAYALKIAGIPEPQRGVLVRESLESVGLSHLARRSARVLSGGEQQRLALARAWAVQPEVLFLDEPTASLDPSSARAVENIIASIHRAGTKIIMTTHDLGLARRLADEIVFLHQGRLLDHQPAGAFFGFPATEEARAFLAGTLDW